MYNEVIPETCYTESFLPWAARIVRDFYRINPVNRSNPIHVKSFIDDLGKTVTLKIMFRLASDTVYTVYTATYLLTKGHVKPHGIQFMGYMPECPLAPHLTPDSREIPQYYPLQHVEHVVQNKPSPRISEPPAPPPSPVRPIITRSKSQKDKTKPKTKTKPKPKTKPAKRGVVRATRASLLRAKKS